MNTRISEQGMTLIEVQVALFILAIGVVGTVSLFTVAKAASLNAQRHEVAVHQAQKEMEYLRSLSYEQLGLTGTPPLLDRLENDPAKIGYHNESSTTDGSAFVVKSATGGGAAITEHLVLPDSDPDGVLSPAPTPFIVGDMGISGKVHRFVTWRPEDCGLDVGGAAICPGDRDTKRLIVAVTIDTGGGSALSKPVWMTSITIDPQAQPL
jgi:prepilin-type N-terminal cleavage/methylation domain-containing protein